MHVEKINIRDIGGIKNLELNLNIGMNIVCGPNGVGKTTIIECIAQSFNMMSHVSLRRRANSSSGQVEIIVNNDDARQTGKIDIKDFVPLPTNSTLQYGLSGLVRKVLSLKIDRNFLYQPLNSISTDLRKEDHQIWSEIGSGVNVYEVKGWFVNRHIWSAHPQSLTKSQRHNYGIAESYFAILDPSISFSHVAAATNDIMLNSPKGTIYYEYLSSGFKSALAILFGIVKDIEYRFPDPGVKVDEFDGIILIDEIDAHLHPEWQVRIAKILTNAFPRAQFIVTTHSPHVIQAASSSEIIALESDGEETVCRDLPDGKFGFQGWTIEEVLSDVMGMDRLRTDEFQARIDGFGRSIDSEDYSQALTFYNDLDRMLHPKSNLRKIFKLQLSSIEGA